MQRLAFETKLLLTNNLSLITSMVFHLPCSFGLETWGKKWSQVRLPKITWTTQHQGDQRTGNGTMSIWHFVAWGNMALKNTLEISVWWRGGGGGGECLVNQLKVKQHTRTKITHTPGHTVVAGNTHKHYIRHTWTLMLINSPRQWLLTLSTHASSLMQNIRFHYYTHQIKLVSTVQNSISALIGLENVNWGYCTQYNIHSVGVG